MEYAISQELLNALAQYLAGRPYVEVVQIINALGNLKKIEDGVLSDPK